MENIRTVVEFKDDYGKIEFLFQKVMEEKGLNRNQVANRAKVSHDLVTRWCKGNIEKLDIGVLARICYVLDCQVSDVMRYTKNIDCNGFGERLWLTLLYVTMTKNT